MRYVRAFFAFWYDFIVGDDWRDAVAVVVAIAVTAFAAHHGLNAWWFLPAVVAAGLTLAITRASRTSRAARRREAAPPAS